MTATMTAGNGHTVRTRTTPMVLQQSINALPAGVDLFLYRGDDFTLTVTVTNPDGTPADLTGAVAAAQIRATADTADPPAGAFTTSIAGDVITLTLTHTVSAALPPSGVWDVQVTANTKITTLAAGRVTVTPDVTRP